MAKFDQFIFYEDKNLECRPHCGACCIAPSINKPYFGMPNGKAAGQTCVHLDTTTFFCKIWNTPNYPATCKQFTAERDFCGSHRTQALRLIQIAETQTTPTPASNPLL